MSDFITVPTFLPFEPELVDRCIGYPSFIKDRIKLGSLQILALVQLQNFQNF